MKKLISVLLTLTLVLSLAACGGKKTDETTAPAEETATAQTETSAPASFEGTMEELVNRIIENRPVEFMGAATVIDLTDTSEDGQWMVKSFTGLEDASVITEAAVYEPMMGSLAFSLVTVRVAPDGDAQAVAESMKAGIDPRKWICVEADDLLVAGRGDIVMLIMVSTTGDMTAQSFVDAFQTVMGGDCDFVI